MAIIINNRRRYQSYYRYKNIININKNSKLREFYNVRGRFIFYKKPFRNLKLVRRFRSMKWMIARFRMVPREQKFPSLFRRHNVIFKKKQQLKNFYGKLNEKKLKKIVLKTKNNTRSINNISYYDLIERRLDMVLYRAKILPTIFACNQLLNHKKILINNYIGINSVCFPIKSGDFLSLKATYWKYIYKFLIRKINKRSIGHVILSNKPIRIPRNRSKNKTRIRKMFYKNYKYFSLYLEYKKRFIYYLKFCYETTVLGHRVVLNNIWRGFTIYMMYYLYKYLLAFKYSSQNLRRWRIKNYAINDISAYFFKHMVRRGLIYANIAFKDHLYKFALAVKNIALPHINNIDDDGLDLEPVEVLYNYLDKKELLVKIAERYEERGDVRLIKHYKFFKSLKRKKYKKKYPINNPAHLDVYTWFAPKPQWYTPEYLEIDYTSLRIGIIPVLNSEIIYPFNIEIDQMYNFYSNKGY